MAVTARSTFASRPRRRAGRATAAVAAVLLVGSVALVACSSGSDDGGGGAGGGMTASSGGLTVGGLDPVEEEFDAPTTNIAERPYEGFDGSSGTFADFVGKPLVVNLWASWCTPCITEMPEFEAVHQRLGDEVTFVGVNVQDTVAEGTAMARTTGVTYQLVRDPRSTLGAWLGSTNMPTTAFVDSQGVVRKVLGKKLSSDELEREIEALR